MEQVKKVAEVLVGVMTPESLLNWYADTYSKVVLGDKETPSSDELKFELAVIREEILRRMGS